jgi:hypothetical protein
MDDIMAGLYSMILIYLISLKFWWLFNYFIKS